MQQKNLLEELRFSKTQVASALPKIAELEYERMIMQESAHAQNIQTATLMSELRHAEDSSRHLEGLAHNLVQGVRSEEHAVVQAESQALLRQTGEYDNAMSQMMKNAEESHAAAIRGKDQLLVRLRSDAEAEVLRLRSEADHAFTLMTAERDSALQALRVSTEQMNLRMSLSKGTDVEDYVSAEFGRIQAMSDQLDTCATSIRDVDS